MRIREDKRLANCIRISPAQEKTAFEVGKGRSPVDFFRYRVYLNKDKRTVGVGAPASTHCIH